jgi:hypothetical protein
VQTRGHVGTGRMQGELPTSQNGKKNHCKDQGALILVCN